MSPTLTKKEAGYVDASRRSEHCAMCDMYRHGKRACTLVKGEIAPGGWCRHWEAKK